MQYLSVNFETIGRDVNSQEFQPRHGHHAIFGVTVDSIEKLTEMAR